MAAAEEAPAGAWAVGFGFSKAESGDVCCCCCLTGENPEAAGMDDDAGCCCEPGGENPADVAPSELGLFAAVDAAEGLAGPRAVGLLWSGAWNVPGGFCAAGALVGVGPICSAGGAGLGCCCCCCCCCHGDGAVAAEVLVCALEDCCCCWYWDGAGIARADWGCREGAAAELVV